jgi:YgiT-type zinc finger domain-containing protein
MAKPGDEEGRLMKCFECGGEVIQTIGSVRMTKKDGTLIIFRGIPLSQCRQCGEQYILGKWAEKIGQMMREEDSLVPQEIISVPVIALS